MEDNIFIHSSISLPKNEKGIKAFIKKVPESPGVYKFLDHLSNPLYIGKAKFLNKRISSYFRLSSRTKKIKKLIEQSKFIEFSITNTELECLLLEQFLIKELKPKFNVQFKDDKGYPWIRIDSCKDFPSAQSFLGKKHRQGKFFGPFPNSYAVRDALKVVQRTFKLRNCSDSSFKNRKRPCLQFEIGRCSAPCVGYIDKASYRSEVESAELLLEGKSKKLIDDFYDLMDQFSISKDYEKAAIYRDRISALRDIQRSQSIAGFKEQRDAIYIYTKDSLAKVGVTHVNQGWVTGHQNFLEVENQDEEDILEKFIFHNYLLNEDCPPCLVTSRPLKNKHFIEKSLSQRHSKKIRLVTRPGKKDKGLLDICKSNTEYSLDNKINKKGVGKKLKSLGKILNIKDLNLIESYDVSHHSGDYAVAGCVVYSREGKLKDQYRLYNIDKSNAGNDIASMMELIERRFNKGKTNQLPSLVLIDGGKVHLDFAIKKFQKLNIEGVNVISISKGIRRKANFDTIHLPNGQSLNIEIESPARQLIQEIRDETHRFAITAQMRKKVKSSIVSSIDNFEGVGPERKKLLLRYFGSVQQMKRASIEDLTNVKGIGKELAKSIFINLHK